MYDVPEAFNKDILLDYCQDQPIEPIMCGSLVDRGLGGPITATETAGPLNSSQENLFSPDAWYHTDQFALEVLMHERMKLYACLTKVPKLASAFYLPYYAGLDLTRHLFSPIVQLRDRLSHRFAGWLMGQPEWVRRQGADHLLILGRPVWDFLREEAATNWGNSLLHFTSFQNVTKLLIERDPYASDEKMVGIPYPTSFHPSSDEDVKIWLATVRSAKRDSFVSYAGAPRDLDHSGPLRGNLLRQCRISQNCTLIDCSKLNCPENPQHLAGLFLRSVFCLQPSGDTPTRKGIFDCLVAGCIPVFFNEHSAYTQYLWHLPPDGRDYSVYFDEEEVLRKGMKVVEALAAIPAAKVKAMQEKIIGIIPGIVYAKPGRSPMQMKDAFDIIIDNLFRGSGVVAGGKHGSTIN